MALRLWASILDTYILKAAVAQLTESGYAI